VNVLGGKIVHLTQQSVTVEFTDEPLKSRQLIHMLEPYGIGEIVRTGLVAMKARCRSEEGVWAAISRDPSAAPAVEGC